MKNPITIVIAMFVLLAGGMAITGESREGAAEHVTRSPGKPLHPIQVRAIVDGPVRAGVETEARLIVTAPPRSANIEITLQPELATEISDNRFFRRGNETPRGAPVDFAFRFRPAGNAPQPIKVLVRATRADGRVLTREMTLSLGVRQEAGKRGRKPDAKTALDAPAQGADVVVAAEQEIRRNEGK